MLFLHESPVPQTPAGSPPVSFLLAFRPHCEELPRPQCSVLGSRLPFSRTPAQVVFTLEEPLPGAARVRAVHGAAIARLPFSANTPWPESDGLCWFGPEADVPKLVPMAISTADCLAVAFSVCLGGYAGFALVHAGWRGFSAGMLQEAVGMLLAAGASHALEARALLENLEVVVSPAIFGQSYECGYEVRDALEEHFALRVLPLVDYEKGKIITEVYHDCLRSGSFNAPAGKIHPDLQLLAVCDLEALGVPRHGIRVVRVNTAGHAELPSYRHASQHGGNPKRRLFTHLVFA